MLRLIYSSHKALLWGAYCFVFAAPVHAGMLVRECERAGDVRAVIKECAEVGIDEALDRIDGARKLKLAARYKSPALATLGFLRCARNAVPRNSTLLGSVLFSHQGTVGGVRGATLLTERTEIQGSSKKSANSPAVEDIKTLHGWIDSERANLLAALGHLKTDVIRPRDASAAGLLSLQSCSMFDVWEQAVIVEERLDRGKANDNLPFECTEFKTPAACAPVFGFGR